MEELANEIYECFVDMDFMDYLDTKEQDLEELQQGLELLEKQGNKTLINAIKGLVELMEEKEMEYYGKIFNE